MAGKTSRSARPDLGSPENAAVLELFRHAAVLQVRGIAQINKYGFGQIDDPGDFAADRREASLRCVFRDRDGLPPRARCARRLPGRRPTVSPRPARRLVASAPQVSADVAINGLSGRRSSDVSTVTGFPASRITRT